MNATIIFGTKKLGQTTTTNTSSSNEKYPDIPVVTVEGQKGAKKSRRILINSKAALLLNCPQGEVQNIVFASVEMGENTPKQVLITNESFLPQEVEVSYKTSKNKVAYDESNEKGKAVTSSHACNEILTFLGLNDEGNTEFKLVPFESNDLKAFSLSTKIEDDIIETNNASLSANEVVNETIAEVQRAEANSPVLQEYNSPELVDIEDTIQYVEENELEVADAVDSDWA